MVNSIEEFLQINIHHDPATGLQMFLDLGDGCVRAPPRTEAVTARMECRLEDRLQNLEQSLLRDAVHHIWHTPRELHIYPVDLWDRLKSSIRFIPYEDSGSSF